MVSRFYLLIKSFQASKPLDEKVQFFDKPRKKAELTSDRKKNRTKCILSTFFVSDVNSSQIVAIGPLSFNGKRKSKSKNTYTAVLFFKDLQN